ncbi:MAG TPA: hypothetical protein VMY06_05270 [Sedimentisphaerales bacterium]|nr:hypothetical protein [Sedimentisphaerales bacterium]
MILPRFIRKILAVFRGSVSPVFIVLSVALGFWFGLVPGWSGFHTAIVILVLVLNIHTGLFLLSAAVGKSLCLAAAPVLFHTGAAVQNYLAPLLSLLASIPLIGITDFSRYSVAGAIVVGPVIGLAAGLLLVRAVISFRRMLLKFEEGSEQFKKWYSNRWVRILDRLLIGKRTKDAKALFTAKTKIVRKAGAVIAALVLVVSAIATTLVKDSTIKDYATKTMTKANGAEVNVESLDLSVLTGAVSASGIQVTNSEKPQNNQVSIEKIIADASVYNLLTGKLVMDNVEVSNVKFNQKRDTPGKVVEAKSEGKPSVFDPCDFKIEVADIHKLEGYFKDAKAVKEWLQKLSKWLPKGKEKAVTGPEEIPQKYLDYLDARAVVPPSPRVLAKRIKLDNVEIPSQLFGNSSVLLKNISDSPQTAKLPVTLEIKSHDTGAFVNITFDYASDEQRPRVSGTFDGLDLSKIQSNLSGDSALVFEKGTASGRFEGTVTNEAVDLMINVGISDMKAKAQGKEVFGLSSKTTSEALGVLENLNTTIRIVGPATEPRLVFDVKDLQENLKQALVKAGKERLAQEIDKQIGDRLDDKLGDKVPSEIKEALKKPKKLIEGLGGLFRKKDDNKEE